MKTYDFSWNRRAHVRSATLGYGMDRSLFLPKAPYVPPIKRPTGTVDFYDPDKIYSVRAALADVDEESYLNDIVNHVASPELDVNTRVQLLLGFIHREFYYNPLETPTDPDTGREITDVRMLLELHDAKCGQAAIMVKAFAKVMGLEARTAPLNYHVVAEIFWDGAWHHCDALIFGSNIPEKNGVWPSTEDLKAAPYFFDAMPMECFVYAPWELLNGDGYGVLGYVFGEWGSLPYYSTYLSADEDYPPTLPGLLPAQRMDEQRVRLRWSESIKRNGGAVRYDLKIATDPEFRNVIEQVATEKTSFVWPTPEMNCMYFFAVRAVDDHQQFNPDTWYPWAHRNFVLVPPEQYGWYGVM